MEKDHRAEKWKTQNSNSGQEIEVVPSVAHFPIQKDIEFNSISQEIKLLEKHEDFDFGTCGGEICLADDIFFNGRILPFCPSAVSETGPSSLTRNISRSDIFSSENSRSNSTNSTSSSVFNTSSSKNPNSRTQNRFTFTHPSPKPQIRIPTKTRKTLVQKSSMWDVVKLGLVRTPIEINSTTINRVSVSRNSSSSSSRSNSSTKMNKNSKVNRKFDVKHGLIIDKPRGLLFNSGCKCSISAIETVPLNKRSDDIVTTKSSSGRYDINGKKKGWYEKSKKAMHENEGKRNVMDQKQDGKEALSRDRTFEWLKELSHANYVHHQSSHASF